ncbi:Predicted dehydrogenase [Nakamurella panacisegetis]|uniref:Predicted dehydrogenase n=1 Tax=Nakamurella panacisegetis TaxID=1090615 RepID=A0A1H0N5V6_9ACTN|nr:Gfo/Idh/MocA family oxidoreductase [Nakamurella panacisegetis]SDO88018.1 Predicted dehydrogenase [Nakamurella panacisegetis]
MTALRIALVGCGDISAVHLDAIAAHGDAELVAVCDVERSRLTAASQRWDVTPYPGFESMLEAERPDVVHICTPHAQHAAMTTAALRRNVNVLVEKPVATSMADAQEVQRAAEGGSAIVGVCYQNRYNNTSQALRSLIDTGALGALRGGRASVDWFRDNSYYERRPWRGTWAEGGGGVLINQSIHTLDLLQWFLGEVVDVRGQASRLTLDDPVEVEDTASIVLRHRGGAGSIFQATNSYIDNAPVMIELLADRATVRLENDLTVTYTDGQTLFVAADGIATGEKAYWGLSHERLIDDFYRHVRRRRPFWIDPAAAMETLRIVTDVYAQSDLARRRPGRWPGASLDRVAR